MARSGGLMETYLRAQQHSGRRLEGEGCERTWSKGSVYEINME